MIRLGLSSILCISFLLAGNIAIVKNVTGKVYAKRAARNVEL